MSTIFANKIKNNQGGNDVKVNQLSGIDTAGSITVQGEGSATTNLQQGLGKCFSALAHEGGTPTAKDTFNVASYTDQNTGAVTVHYTNNMSVAIHCVTALANYRSGSAQFKHISYNNNTAFTTASHELISGEGSWSKYDAENMSSVASGDLA